MPPSSVALSSSQLATLAALGEERTANAGDVLYQVGDRNSPRRRVRDAGRRADM